MAEPIVIHDPVELPKDKFFVFYDLDDIDAARRKLEGELGQGYWKPRKDYKASIGWLAIEVINAEL